MFFKKEISCGLCLSVCLLVCLLFICYLIYSQYCTSNSQHCTNGNTPGFEFCSSMWLTQGSQLEKQLPREYDRSWSARVDAQSLLERIPRPYSTQLLRDLRNTISLWDYWCHSEIQ